MFATSSARRVTEQTPQHVREQIQRKLEANVAYYAANPQLIDSRLGELDREWDIERALETWASGLAGVSLLRGLISGRRKWLILPLVVQGFMMQHALQGWCPPVAVMRRLGFRTRTEIDEERYALKALRGDFKDAPAAEEKQGQTLHRIVEAARC